MKLMDLIISERIYQFTTQIPRGRISTYGILAREVGMPKASRWIGRILSNNPKPKIIPCHRVVYSNGGIGGYVGGVGMKIRMLKSEGISVKNGKIIEFEKKIFSNFSNNH